MNSLFQPKMTICPICRSSREFTEPLRVYYSNLSVIEGKDFRPIKVNKNGSFVGCKHCEDIFVFDNCRKVVMVAERKDLEAYRAEQLKLAKQAFPIN